jgi:uncharacterized membrane protein
MDRKRRTQRLTLAAFFVAVQAVLTVTPVGYLPLGPISITTMHIPVILAGILLGPAFGAGIGFVFGMSSMLRATFSPGLTSFLFSPFITIGGVSGNFGSLLIVFGPRILLGWLSGMTFRALTKTGMKETASAMIAAGLNTVIHTLLVMGGIWLFFGEPYAAVLGISPAGLAGAIGAVVVSNGLPEAGLAAVVIPALIRALSPAVKRMGFNESRGNKHAVSADYGRRQHAY